MWLVFWEPPPGPPCGHVSSHGLSGQVPSALTQVRQSSSHPPGTPKGTPPLSLSREVKHKQLLSRVCRHQWGPFSRRRLLDMGSGCGFTVSQCTRRDGCTVVCWPFCPQGSVQGSVRLGCVRWEGHVAISSSPEYQQGLLLQRTNTLGTALF